MLEKKFFNYLAQTSDSPPAYHFKKGKGIYLIDKKGRKYIDIISGISVNNIGHCNPSVLKAIRKQSKKYLHQMVYGEYVITPQVELAEKLHQMTFPHLTSSYFVNSGSEAIEGALKLAKKATGRKKIVAIKNAYHGSSHGALSLMSSAYYSQPFKPLLPEVYFATLNDVKSLNIIDDQTACVVIEGIQAESGYLPASSEFLKEIQNVCKKNGVLLVLDEIQSGIGRTGSFIYAHQADIKPDILCLAKGLGGGMPLGCFMANDELMKKISTNPILGHITTFGGHPVSCAAALATLKFIDKRINYQELVHKEQLFRSKLIHPKIKIITGKGLMMAIHLSSFEEVDFVCREAFNNGLIIDWFLYNQNALRLSPPLIINEKQILKTCDILISVLNKLEA
jgi:acetylornithine/succinyldiaminopimelate/putrescine aminotransferase